MAAEDAPEDVFILHSRKPYPVEVGGFLLARLFSPGPRLLAAAELASGAQRLADIGSDHARLPVWMLLHGMAETAVASDISESAAEKARRAAVRYGLTDRLSARVSDGLSAFSPDEADTVVIAGLGGDVIGRIVSAAPWLADGKHRLIVQCMSSLDALNSYIVPMGFRVLDERLVRDAGRLYSVALLAAGADGYEVCDGFLLPSRHITHSPYCSEYLNRLISYCEACLKGALKRGGSSGLRDAELLRAELMHYRTLSEVHTVENNAECK